MEASRSELCTCDHSASDVIVDQHCPIHGSVPPVYDLDDEFEAFMRRCYPMVKEHSRQYLESRRIFIAGIASCYFYVVSLARYDVDEAEKELLNLQKQLDEFFMKKMGFNQ
jgi:hypothetical protein